MHVLIQVSAMTKLIVENIKLKEQVRRKDKLIRALKRKVYESKR